MEVKKYNGRAFFYWKDLGKEGKVCTLPFANYGDKPNELFSKIRELFNQERVHYFHVGDMREIEDVLWYINENITVEEDDYEIEFYQDSTEEYVILFDDVIAVCLYAYDEYNGGGDFSLGLTLKGIALLQDDIPFEKIEEVYHWLDKAFKGEY